MLRDLFKHCNGRTKLMITYNIIISMLRYALSPLVKANKWHINKLRTLVMKNSSPSIGFPSYKMSASQIMSKLQWHITHDMIIAHSIMSMNLMIYLNIYIIQ